MRELLTHSCRGSRSAYVRKYVRFDHFSFDSRNPKMDEVVVLSFGFGGNSD